jgi:hypothetical protein
MDQINTEGLVEVGEVTTRVMRDARLEFDFANAQNASRVNAFNEILVWTQEQILQAGPYDDTRHLKYLVVWLGDKIREVHPATMEETHA